MKALLLVSLAGAVGTAMRFGVGRALGPWAPPDFPWATFAVNVIGCFLLGIVTEAAGDRRVADVELRSILGVGVMGGFTTYSSFDIEMLRLGSGGAGGMAFGYGAATVATCLVAGAAGLALGRAVRS
jgi:CrcB protein